MRDDVNPRLHRLLIPLAALLAVAPLIVHGASCGHDFDFHLLSWFEAAQQLVHGHFPQWAYTPAYNAGEPRFVFYPPLSWLLGALLGLVMPWGATPVVFTWLALTASGFTLHRLARQYTGSTPALLAATFYLANPYMLFTAYERTAYGELLAAAWIPLLLQAALAPEISIGAIALPVALLWLTNAPAAVMSCYALAGIALIRLFQTAPLERLAFAAKVIAGTILGLTLASFYLLPAAYEQRFVEVSLAVVPGMRIADNTLFHHTDDPAHDAVLHTASILAVLLLSLTAIALSLAFRARHNSCHPERAQRVEGPPYFAQIGIPQTTLLPLVLIAAAILLLLLPISLPIWHRAPELVFLQFPWRFLAILVCILSLASALAIANLNLNPRTLALVSLGTAFLLMAPAYGIFHQLCDDPDTVPARLALFHSKTGSDPTDEYTPATADNDWLQHADPPYWLASPQQPDAQPAQDHPGQAPHHLTLDLPAPEILVLNLRNYPAWRITCNGAPIAQRGRRDDGLIAIPLPAGLSTIDVAESRPPDRIAGDALSGFGLLVFIVLARRNRFAAAKLA